MADDWKKTFASPPGEGYVGYFVVEEGDNIGEHLGAKYPFGMGVWGIGRAKGMAIRFKGKMGISEHHADLEVTKSGINLVDKKSRNGTFMYDPKSEEPETADATKLLPGRQYPLIDGAVVNFGRFTLSLHLYPQQPIVSQSIEVPEPSDVVAKQLLASDDEDELEDERAQSPESCDIPPPPVSRAAKAKAIMEKQNKEQQHQTSNTKDTLNDASDDEPPPPVNRAAKMAAIQKKKNENTAADDDEDDAPPPKRESKSHLPKFEPSTLVTEPSEGSLTSISSPKGGTEIVNTSGDTSDEEPPPPRMPSKRPPSLSEQVKTPSILSSDVVKHSSKEPSLEVEEEDKPVPKKSRGDILKEKMARRQDPVSNTESEAKEEADDESKREEVAGKPEKEMQLDKPAEDEPKQKKKSKSGDSCEEPTDIKKAKTEEPAHTPANTKSNPTKAEDSEESLQQPASIKAVGKKSPAKFKKPSSSESENEPPRNVAKKKFSKKKKPTSDSDSEQPVSKKTDKKVAKKPSKSQPESDSDSSGSKRPAPKKTNKKKATKKPSKSQPESDSDSSEPEKPKKATKKKAAKKPAKKKVAKPASDSDSSEPQKPAKKKQKRPTDTDDSDSHENTKKKTKPDDSDSDSDSSSSSSRVIRGRKKVVKKKPTSSATWFFMSDLRKKKGGIPKKDEKSAWTAYSKSDSKTIETAFVNKKKKVNLKAGDNEYYIVFEDLIQYRKDDDNLQRPVMRSDPA